MSNSDSKDIKVKSVEKLAMEPTDVLFVTIAGKNHDGQMIKFLHEELQTLLGHERFMIITDAIKLQIISGKEIEVAKSALELVKSGKDEEKEDKEKEDQEKEI